MLDAVAFDAPLTPRNDLGQMLQGSGNPGVCLTSRRADAMLDAFIDLPTSHRGLTVFPVVARQGPVLPYLLSTQVQDTDVLVLRDQEGESGTMTLARNNSLHDVLLLGRGLFLDEGPGRVRTRSFLIRGKSVTRIPGPTNGGRGRPLPEEEADAASWVGHFPLKEHQVGALAFMGRQALGLEALGAANLYEQVHPWLVTRLALETLRAGISPGPLQTPEALGALTKGARELVEALERADRVEAGRVGLGRYWELKGAVEGGELIHEGALVHLSVRPADAGAGWPTGKEE